MVCCALQPAHRILALRSSMALAYKMNDFIYAAFFAKKIVTVAEVISLSFLLNLVGQS